MVLGNALSLLLALAFGGALGLVAGLLVLPSLASARLRDAVRGGPTPEAVPNYVLLTAAGGVVHAGLVGPASRVVFGRLLPLRAHRFSWVVAGGVLAVVAGGALLRLDAVGRRAEGRRRSVGGRALLVAVGAGYAAAVSVLWQVV